MSATDYTDQELLMAAASISALHEAADFFAHDMAEAWGGDQPWLTSGTKCGRVVADVLKELASAIERGATEARS